MFYDLKVKVIIESNDDDFYETKFPFKSRDNGDTSGSASANTTPDHTPVIRESDENIQQDVIKLRRSKTTRIVKEYGPDYVPYTLEEDPSTLKKSLSSLDAHLWQ